MQVEHGVVFHSLTQILGSPSLLRRLTAKTLQLLLQNQVIHGRRIGNLAGFRPPQCKVETQRVRHMTTMGHPRFASDPLLTHTQSMLPNETLHTKKYQATICA